MCNGQINDHLLFIYVWYMYGTCVNVYPTWHVNCVCIYIYVHTHTCNGQINDHLLFICVWYMYDTCVNVYHTWHINCVCIYICTHTHNDHTRVNVYHMCIICDTSIVLVYMYYTNITCDMYWYVFIHVWHVIFLVFFVHTDFFVSYTQITCIHIDHTWYIFGFHV